MTVLIVEGDFPLYIFLEKCTDIFASFSFYFISGELFGSDASSSDEDENPVKPVIKVKPPGQNVSPNGNLMFSDPSRQASPGAKLWTPPPQPSPHPFENNTER